MPWKKEGCLQPREGVLEISYGGASRGRVCFGWKSRFIQATSASRITNFALNSLFFPLPFLSSSFILQKCLCNPETCTTHVTIWALLTRHLLKCSGKELWQG